MRPLPLAMLATLAVSLASCSSKDSAEPAAAAPNPLSWSVLVPGQFGCGHRELSTTYTPPGGLPARTIPVHVWYPTNETTGDHSRYHVAFPDVIALEGVALAPPAFAAGFPVLVHSHGYKGFAGNSARLMCHFASHGWLAVAPEHLGNTISDTPDKQPLSVYIHRPMDIRASLDFLGTIPKDDPLSGKADLSHVGMSGHSFGTYTTWVIGGAPVDAAGMKKRCDSGEVTPCSPAELAALGGDLSDARPKMVIPMAGAPNGEIAAASYDSARVPVLMMSGSLNPVGDDVIYAATSKVDLGWVDVDGGCHQLYGLGNSVLGDAKCAVLPDEEGFSLVNPWVVAYARYHVLADRSEQVKGIVEGTISVSPKVHAQRKRP